MKEILFIITLSFSWGIVYFLIKFLYKLSIFSLITFPIRISVKIWRIFSGIKSFRRKVSLYKTKNEFESINSKILKIDSMLAHLQTNVYTISKYKVVKLLIISIYSEKVFFEYLSKSLKKNESILETDQSVFKCFSNDDNYKIFGKYFIENSNNIKEKERFEILQKL